MEAARKIVDKLIVEGKVPKADLFQEVDSVTYDEREVDPETGEPSHNDITAIENEAKHVELHGRITIYRQGATSLETAIRSYAHELGHFNRGWVEPVVKRYEDAVVNVYKGGTYNGPRPSYLP